MDHLIECSFLDAMAVDFALENLETQTSECEWHNRREFAPEALVDEVRVIHLKSYWQPWVIMSLIPLDLSEQ